MSVLTVTQKDGVRAAAESSQVAGDHLESEFVVIGGGPAGLTAAYQLSQRGKHPLVLEQSHTTGGISRTENYRGFHFDMGGHRFFTKSDEVLSFWNEVLSDDLRTRPRLSRIYYRNKFFNYPLKPLNALFGLGPIEAIRILLSYARWSLFPYREVETFEQWVTNRFGKRLFEIFFKSYTEKVWGVSCSELRAEWAAQRIKDLSLKTAVWSMFFKPRTTVQTLIDSFLYPRLGPGMLWQKVSNLVEQNGGDVWLNSGVVGLKRVGREVVSVDVMRDGRIQSIRGKQFISSMPVTDFIKKLEPPPPKDVLAAADQLKYRDFLTVGLIVDKTDLFPDNWIYIHEPNVKVGRIQNFGNWSPDMVPVAGKSSIGLEYFCSVGDELWTTDDAELIEAAKRELETLGLARYEDVEDGCVFRVPKAYPVYDASYGDVLGIIRDYVNGFENFQTIGRNGLHRYNNQDHAMLTGMLAVRNALDGETNNLWIVNGDKQYHEEIREAEPIPSEPEIRQVSELLFLKLDRIAMGISTGVVTGIVLFIATLILVLKGGDTVGPHLGLLSQYFPGYQVTWWGSLLGLLYGFGSGFVLGSLFATIRNMTIFFSFALRKTRFERKQLLKFFDYI